MPENDIPIQSFLVGETLVEDFFRKLPDKKSAFIEMDRIFNYQNWNYSSNERLSNLFIALHFVASKTEVETMFLVGSFEQMMWLDRHWRKFVDMIDSLFNPDDSIILDKRGEEFFTDDYLGNIYRTESGVPFFDVVRIMPRDAQLDIYADSLDEVDQSEYDVDNPEEPSQN